MKQRIITGLVLIAIFTNVIFILPILFTPLIGIILGISSWEWCRITKIHRSKGIPFTIVTVLLWIAAVIFPNTLTVLLILTILHYFYAIRLIYNYEKIQDYRINLNYLTACGPIVLASLSASLLYIFNYSADEASSEDAFTLAFIILVIAAADSGAYFVGRIFGKHKLSPRVSPKKTIEGLIGGLISVVLVVALCGFMVEGWFLSFWQLLFISIITALSSVVGDLFISIIKRQNDIKDASNILPGHGGFLDRIDGLLAGIPVFYLLQQLVNIVN